MAAQKQPVKDTDAVEQRLIAFAEQLGTLVGTVQAKTEGWLDRDALGKQLATIRDNASELLDQVSPDVLKRATATAKAKPTSKPTPTPTTNAPKAAAKPPIKASRGLVDAPGKRHRKPPPQQRAGKHASGPKARVIGNPGLKTGRRGGRG
jgi:hypothetical protein